jgi:hypothetical protein
MNRRNFFSLAGMSAVAMVANKFFKPSLEESFQRDLNAWIQKYRGLMSVPPLSSSELQQAHMLSQTECPSHSHSINDPGHSHSIPLQANPNWIPCDQDPNWRRWYRDGSNSWQLL